MLETDVQSKIDREIPILTSPEDASFVRAFLNGRRTEDIKTHPGDTSSRFDSPILALSAALDKPHAKMRGVLEDEDFRVSLKGSDIVTVAEVVRDSLASSPVDATTGQATLKAHNTLAEFALQGIEAEGEHEKLNDQLKELRDMRYTKIKPSFSFASIGLDELDKVS